MVIATTQELVGVNTPAELPYSVPEAAQNQEANLGQYFVLAFKLALSQTLFYSNRNQREEKM